MIQSPRGAIHRPVRIFNLQIRGKIVTGTNLQDLYFLIGTAH